MSASQKDRNGTVTRIGRDEMRNLSKRSDAPGLQRLLLLALVIAATGSLIFNAFGSYWLLPALFIHGVVLAHLFSLQHESEHHTAFKSRWLCDVVSTVCGSSFWCHPDTSVTNIQPITVILTSRGLIRSLSTSRALAWIMCSISLQSDIGTDCCPPCSATLSISSVNTRTVLFRKPRSRESGLRPFCFLPLIR